MGGTSLEYAVASALRALHTRRVAEPRALFLLATGAGHFPERLSGAGRTNLGDIDGTPECWRGIELCHGDLAGLPVWVVEDRPELAGDGSEGWTAAFPCWLAKEAGALVLVHASAASSLPGIPGLFDAGPPPGSLAFVSDHINLTGTSPLLGLGETKLGPLFPDQSRLHHPVLRRRAMELARELGHRGAEVVAACTLGPAIETPAERRWLRRSGAEISVQGLAQPLIAAAHAGLRALAIAAVVHAGDGPMDLPSIVSASQASAPALENLLAALGPDVGRLARRESDVTGA